MNIGKVDLNLLVALDALLTELNVSRAAARLDLSQPAMSSTLNRLRKLLGDKILIRSGNTMLPTPRALEIAQPVKKLIGDVEGLLFLKTDFDAGAIDERFRISTTDEVQHLLAPLLVKRIFSEAPSAALDFVHLDRQYAFEAMESGRVTLALSVNWYAPQQLKQSRLFDQSFACMVRNDHPVVGKRLTLKQFTELDHLLVSPMGHTTGRVDAALAQQGLKRNVRMVVPSFLGAPSILMQTDLVTTISRRVAAQLQKQFPLKVLKPPIEIPEYSIYMYWHPRFDASASHQWLRNHCKQAATSVA